jgi:hypothetical protein
MMPVVLSARAYLGIGGTFRLCVGAGYLLAPEVVAGRIAPDVRGNPDGRMSLRGFGALHVGVAIASLRAAAREETCRDAALLNLACAIGDTIGDIAGATRSR